MTLWRNTQRFIAEFIGTYVLVFTHAGLNMAAALSLGRLDFVGTALGIGFSLISLIFALCDVSGAHFNPWVTLAFTLRRVFPIHLVPLYLVAEFSGGYLAAYSLLRILGDVDNLGSNVAKGVSLYPTLFTLELMATAFFIFFILRVANRGGLVGSQSGLAVGSALALFSLFIGNFGGGSMNLIRTLSVATFSNQLYSAGVLIGAQGLGMIIAVILAYVCDVNRAGGEEYRVAVGESPA